ncbi:MAG: GNAT family N-acetyltransferase, partial [Myxococcota bacterium]
DDDDDGDEAATRAHMQMRLERQEKWNQQYGAWALENRRDGTVVGTGLMKPLRGHRDEWTDDIEIGWHLARAEWGKGYATEMAEGLLDVARSRGLQRIHAVIEATNTRSAAVAARLGFEHQGSTTAYYDGLLLEHYMLQLANAAAQ